MECPFELTVDVCPFDSRKVEAGIERLKEQQKLLRDSISQSEIAYSAYLSLKGSSLKISLPAKVRDLLFQKYAPDEIKKEAFCNEIIDWVLKQDWEVSIRKKEVKQDE